MIVSITRLIARTGERTTDVNERIEGGEGKKEREKENLSRSPRARLTFLHGVDSINHKVFRSSAHQHRPNETLLSSVVSFVFKPSIFFRPLNKSGANFAPLAHASFVYQGAQYTITKSLRRDTDLRSLGSRHVSSSWASSSDGSPSRRLKKEGQIAFVGINVSRVSYIPHTLIYLAARSPMQLYVLRPVPPNGQ